MSLSMVCFMSQPSTMCLRSLNRFAHRHALCLYWSTRRNIKQGENKYMGPARTWYRKMSMLCCQMDVCKYSRQLSKDPRHASAFGRDWKSTHLQAHRHLWLHHWPEGHLLEREMAGAALQVLGGAGCGMARAPRHVCATSTTSAPGV